MTLGIRFMTFKVIDDRIQTKDYLHFPLRINPILRKSIPITRIAGVVDIPGTASISHFQDTQVCARRGYFCAKWGSLSGLYVLIVRSILKG